MKWMTMAAITLALLFVCVFLVIIVLARVNWGNAQASPRTSAAA